MYQLGGVTARCWGRCVGTINTTQEEGASWHRWWAKNKPIEKKKNSPIIPKCGSGGGCIYSPKSGRPPPPPGDLIPGVDPLRQEAEAERRPRARPLYGPRPGNRGSLVNGDSPALYRNPSAEEFVARRDMGGDHCGIFWDGVVINTALKPCPPEAPNIAPTHHLKCHHAQIKAGG